MDCKTIKDLIHPYLKKELPVNEANLINSHLKDCGDCSDYKTDIEMIISGLSPVSEAPEYSISLPERNPVFMFFRRVAVPALAVAVLLVALFIPFETEETGREFFTDNYTITQINTNPPESGHILDDIILL